VRILVPQPNKEGPRMRALLFWGDIGDASGTGETGMCVRPVSLVSPMSPVSHVHSDAHLPAAASLDVRAPYRDCALTRVGRSRPRSFPQPHSPSGPPSTRSRHAH